MSVRPLGPRVCGQDMSQGAWWSELRCRADGFLQGWDMGGRA